MNEEESKPKRPRGFAAMDPTRQKEIASQGGKAATANGTLYRFTPEKAREAGALGGAKIVALRGSAHFREMGRKGGLASGRKAARRRAERAAEERERS